MSAWFDCSKNQPSDERMILVCDNINKIHSIGKYLEESNAFECFIFDEFPPDTYITHWKELDFPEE